MGLTKIDDRGLKTPIDLLDNEKIRLGTGNDVELHHDGTNSILNNTTGELQVTTDGIIRFNATEYKFNNAANNEIVARFEQDGACELYHNHAKKLETSAGGVNITGELNVTTKVAYPDGAKAIFGTGDDLQLYHDGADDRIMSGSTNSMIIASKYLRIQNQASNETMAKFTENGAVELNYDNSKKFQTQSDGVEILSTGSWHGLEVKHSNGNVVAKLQNKGSGDEGYFALYDSGETGPSIHMDGEHGRITATSIRLHTNNAANELDDYEEGTFSFNESNISVSNYDAKYTKIGRIVMCSARLNFGSSSDTSTLNLTGLPFTPDSGAGNSTCGGVIPEQNVGLGAIFMAVEHANNTVRIRKDDGAVVTPANMSNKSIRFVLWYIAT